MLQLSGITKRFRSETVLRGIDLAVDDGETVVIFGPSGSGKTVLLRVIAGVEDPNEGAVLIDGRDMVDAAPEARGIGMAFQNFALFPHMSAFENIASPLKARRSAADKVTAGVQSVARLLKIDHVLDHAPRELSNGQKQRTALARALAPAPRILLLDDPLRNVDAKLRYEMRLELPRLLAEFRSTALYVTQDYKEAMALGSRIAVLIDGRFVQVASPEDIYLRPASLDVARLFGDPTICAIPSAIEPGPAIGLLGGRFALDPRFAAFVGREVTVGLRPEDIAVSMAPVPDAVPVDLVTVTPLNERDVMLLNGNGGEEFFASAPEARGTGARSHGPAFARFDTAAMHLFDRATGARLEVAA
ncbi:MAG: ABC transporter ATP-binding protein [Alphaproteobacteria bacterium]